MNEPAANIDAEKAVLGAMLIAPKAIPAVARMLVASDFYQPRNESLYALLLRLHDDGVTLDPVVVAAQVATAGLTNLIEGIYLHELVSNVLTASNVEYHADLVKAASRRRSAQQIATRIGQTADQVIDHDHFLDALARESLALNVLIEERALDAPLEGLYTWDGFIEKFAGQNRDWVVPGLISLKDVVMCLAPPGAGKTTLSRQLAWCIASGIHPFTLERIQPQRTLLVDFENDEGEAADESAEFLSRIRRIGDWDPDRAHIWAWPQGENIRTREGAARLEQAISETRPRFVAIGSLYKAAPRMGTDWDTAADEGRAAFDKLRNRHRFALWIEHHMPKAQGGGKSPTPFGSMIWESWPSHGRILQRTTKGPNGPFSFTAPFRGDRGKRDYPVGFTRGGKLPWTAVFHQSDLDALTEACEEPLRDVA